MHRLLNLLGSRVLAGLFELGTFARWVGGSAVAAMSRMLGASTKLARTAGDATGTKLKHGFRHVPHRVLHALSGKLLEIMVFLVAAAGLAYFLQDPQALRGERLACWLSDFAGETIDSGAPLEEGTSFRVLLAQLDGDEGGHETANVRVSFAKELPVVEVRELCRSLGVAPGQSNAAGTRDAEKRAQALLSAWHADAIVWGLAAANSQLRLRVSTPFGAGQLRSYQLTPDGELPSAFVNEFIVQLQGAMLSGSADDPKGHTAKPALLSNQHMMRLRALALDKKRSYEERMLAATIYATPLLKTEANAPKSVDLTSALEVTASLAGDIDPDENPQGWATTRLLQGSLASQIASDKGDVDGLSKVAQMFQDTAGRIGGRIDQASMMQLEMGDGQARYLRATLTQSLDDMYVAMARFQDARHLWRQGDPPDNYAECSARIALAARWLGRNGDTSYLTIGLQAASDALQGLDPNDGSGEAQMMMLTLADLQSGWASLTNDLRLYNESIGRFNAVLTPQVRASWYETFRLAKQYRADGVAGLARRTGLAEDFARGVKAYDEAMVEWPRETELTIYLQLRAGRGDLIRDWAIATHDAARVRASTDDMTELLKTVDPKQSLEGWGEVKSSIAQGLLAASTIDGQQQSAEQAFNILRDIPKTMERAGDMLLWSHSSVALAQTLSHNAEPRQAPAFAREAAAVLRDVIKRETTRNRMPTEWGNNQFELGMTLYLLGDMTNESGAFTEAAQAFEASLLVRPRDQIPPGVWVDTVEKAGLARVRQGQALGDAAVLEAAVKTLTDAKAFALTQQGDLNTARIGRIIAMADVALAHIKSDVAFAVAARDMMKAALDAIDRQKMPEDWAWTTLRYGEAALAIGTLSRDPKAVEDGRVLVNAAKDDAGAAQDLPLVRAAGAVLAAVPGTRLSSDTR